MSTKPRVILLFFVDLFWVLLVLCWGLFWFLFVLFFTSDIAPISTFSPQNANPYFRIQSSGTPFAASVTGHDMISNEAQSRKSFDKWNALPYIVNSCIMVIVQRNSKPLHKYTVACKSRKIHRDAFELH